MTTEVHYNMSSTNKPKHSLYKAQRPTQDTESKHKWSQLKRSQYNKTAEEVFVELLKTKCLPSLLYGTEACPVILTLV